MSLTSIPVEKALQMSLDEYIIQSGAYISPNLKQPKLDSFNTRTSRIEDPDDTLIDDIDDFPIKNDNSNHSLDGFHDLRPKISNNGVKHENNFNNSQNVFCKNANESLPPLNSQQWRLMPLNSSVQKRPPGMPPLIMHDAAGPFNVLDISRCTSNNSNNTGVKRKHKNKNNNHKNNMNMNNYKNNNNNMNKNNYKHNNMNKNNNNKHNNPIANGYKMNSFNDFLNGHQNNIRNGTNPQDLSISVPAEYVTRSNPVKTSNVQPMGIDSNENLLRNLGNFPINNDIMPLLAKNLLNQLQGLPVTAPPSEKYDLKIQKEIHLLQKKPFVYKCGNEEKPGVLSYDGPGVNNTIHPSTTGISLNQRFA